MSGIYLHIPFCKSKCNYCDFYSVTGTRTQDGFIRTLLDEITFRKEYLANREIDTVYFGGGTPTLLPPAQLALMLNRLREQFSVDRDAEITIEANPDDLTSEKLDLYLDMGFNRISIGTQSFFDEHLVWMNRRHDSVQAIRAVQLASGRGFTSISLDLIYGIPGMTLQQWKQNLDIASGLPADHLSAYHLTIEPGTPFGKLKKSGLLTDIPDELSLEQYHVLLSMLGAAGFEQYEISNFARDGQYSRHNTKYWTGDTYLGLGPSAHSFNGTSRHWNAAGIGTYRQDVSKRKAPDGEIIDPLMQRNEYVMTRLRTSKGINQFDFKVVFGEPAWFELLEMAGKHLRNGHLILENDRIIFEKRAWFHSDGILSDLFLVR
jgi:oxygen-independent coproporphyrinogen-3 oxidase